MDKTPTAPASSVPARFSYLTDEQVADLRRRWDAASRRSNTGEIRPPLYVPRPPRAGLALTVFAAINRVKHRIRRLRRRWS